MVGAAAGSGRTPLEAALQSEELGLALSRFLRVPAAQRLRCTARWCFSPAALPHTHRALAARRSICRSFALVELALRWDSRGNHVDAGWAPQVRLEDLRDRVLARTAGAEALGDARLGQVLALAQDMIQVLEPRQGEVALALHVGGERRVPSTAELAARCGRFEAALAGITDELAAGRAPCCQVPSSAPSGEGPRRRLKRARSVLWSFSKPAELEELGPLTARYELARRQLEVAEPAERAALGAEWACGVLEELLESLGGRVDEERLVRELQRRARGLRSRHGPAVSWHERREARVWISALVAIVEAEVCGGTPKGGRGRGESS
ncbi:unnamed protein product [Prorocentrum cordatum]|uniref:Uncharacterized protein n=1 Tax=Prorocentrum cordatum TaxID=2364126 RepID=A0ABN9VV51_9DINO|nr:unnamed protein product [Polarella glacialis]